MGLALREIDWRERGREGGREGGGEGDWVNYEWRE